MENCRRAIGRLANKLGEQRLSCGKTLDVISCFVLNSEDGQSCFNHVISLVGGFKLLNIFYFPYFSIIYYGYIWDNPSHWLSYFSRWLKPATRSSSSQQNCVWLFNPTTGLLLVFQPHWAMCRILRIRIKETKEVYEGEVTELTPEENWPETPLWITLVFVDIIIIYRQHMIRCWGCRDFLLVFVGSLPSFSFRMS